MNEYLKEAVAEVRNIRTLTGAALMTAATVVLDFFRIIISQSMEISFSFLGVALAGLLYGPYVGGLVGGMSDILEYIIKPSGAFFPGFTLNKILTGVIFGLFLYKQNPTLRRIAIALLVETIVITLILTPIWLNIMYGTALFAVVRVARAVIMYPIRLALLYMLCKSVSAIRLRKTSV